MKLRDVPDKWLVQAVNTTPDEQGYLALANARGLDNVKDSIVRFKFEEVMRDLAFRVQRLHTILVDLRRKAMPEPLLQQAAHAVIETTKNQILADAAESAHEEGLGCDAEEAHRVA